MIATVPPWFRPYFADEGIEWSAQSGGLHLGRVLERAETGPGRPLALWFHHMGAHLSFTKEFIAEFRGTGSHEEVNARYDAAVKRVDADLRKLLDWQAKRGRLDNTIIIISADHGDELGEHGSFGHAMTLYEEVLRVPLVISLPSRKRRVVKQRVSVVDLAPTVRELVGMKPTERTDGISLVPQLEGRESDHHPIYAENFLSSKKKAVIWNDWKLIFTAPGNVHELYELRSDPLERENLVDAEPDRLHALQKVLAACAASGCRW